MPGLTVDTSSPTPSSHSSQHNTTLPATSATAAHSQPSQDTTESQTALSSSASPVEAPPYSPITPTLAAARLASSTTGTSGRQSHHPSNNSSSSRRDRHHGHGGGGEEGGGAHPPQYIYSHSQPAQMGIPPPAPIPVRFEENADALALKSTISILQMQKRQAERDMVVLQRVKERAVGAPGEFLEALGRGDVKNVGTGGVFNDEGDEEEEEEEGEGMQWDKDVEMNASGQDRGLDGTQGGNILNASTRAQTLQAQTPRQKTHEKWERLPASQNVVRCPPINWNQYAVVGESLEKLHQDQLRRPSDGVPARISPEGQYVFGGGEGPRRTSEMGGAIAAPFMPGRDRVDAKPLPRKSAKKARMD